MCVEYLKDLVIEQMLIASPNIVRQRVLISKYHQFISYTFIVVYVQE